MTTRIRLFRGFLISLAAASVTGCLNRAASLNMLDKRAEYDAADGPTDDLRLDTADNEATPDGAVPVRTMPKTAHVWIHPHETAAKEYFWGGWITIVVEGDKWELSRPPGAPLPPTSPASPTKRKQEGEE